MNARCLALLALTMATSAYADDSAASPAVAATTVPHSCLWTFTGGTPASSSNCAPPGVTWATSGTKAVTLKVCRLDDSTICSSLTQNLIVQVVLPPSILAVAITPTPAYAGDTLNFAATVTGKQPFTYRWLVQNGPTLTTNPATWSSAGQTAGTRTLGLTVSNIAGPSTYNTFVTLANPKPVITAVSASPSPALPGQVVTLSATAAGKGTISYSWALPGGGTLTGSPALWNTTGQAIGFKTIILTASNAYGSATASVFLSLNVASNFRALNCPGGVCIFSTNTPIAFGLDYTGFPTLFQYDWDGNGTFEQSSTAPVSLHTYTTTGVFFPKVHVTTSLQSVTVTANTAVSITPPDVGTSFYTIKPCRLVDTRNNDSFSLGKLRSGTPRLYTFGGRCGIPSTAKALSLNNTILNATSSGYLALNPDPLALPTSSAMNFKASIARANSAVIKTGSSASVAFTAILSNSSQTTDLVVDITGYFQ
ncbi:MAG: hypothetical protein ABI609_01075 [Acidobacteriota bacterium]